MYEGLVSIGCPGRGEAQEGFMPARQKMYKKRGKKGIWEWGEGRENTKISRSVKNINMQKKYIKKCDKLSQRQPSMCFFAD